ncbi:DUF4259 domain-containing protein [Actinoplanes solisilvae]|uniref:DUF4259 domain-containing protein n=1 Tax=Actinoplanes solisilvae TaxID=2486853 RepID=UPI000FDC4594|nr:DUF4259 domain-containing protein [Actinoplanes solisilvae]
MGFWDVSPFGNDDAADFAGDLDDAADPPGAAERPRADLDEPARSDPPGTRPDPRVDMVGAVLERIAASGTDDDLDFGDSPRAVAAAALVAAQLPGGKPVNVVFGPSIPMPVFPDYLVPLALKALDRLVTPPSWLAEDWTDEANRRAWRRTVDEIRAVLDPPQAETLFDL